MADRIHPIDRTEREPGSSSEPPTSEPRLGRRALVAGGLGGIVGAALARLQGQAAYAQDDVTPPQPLIVGTENVAFDTTSLLQDGAGSTLRVENLGGGPGIHVVTDESPALLGRSAGVSGVGLLAVGGSLPNLGPMTDIYDPSIPVPAGVVGASSRVGVLGAALPTQGAISIPVTARIGLPVGVLGAGGPLPDSFVITSTRTAKLSGVGVWGSAPSLPGIGMISYTVGAAGVLGTAFGAEQTAVRALNPGGTALQVDGGISVTCGGKGVIPHPLREVEISDPTIKANSVVVVTLTGDPGNPGSSLHHVEVEEGRLRVALTAPPQRDTPFSYLCFELV